jgi:hypothetical protein
MVWTAPAHARVDEPFVADERTMLEGCLDWQRGTLLTTCTGLTGDELARRSVPPSTLSLLGLIRHHIDVERNWFRRRFAGIQVDPRYYSDGTWDRCFDEVDPRQAEAEYAALMAEWDLSRQAVAGASLDQTFDHPRHGTMQLRWVYQHLIEEYARHDGHADLLREAIDGVTGS